MPGEQVTFMTCLLESAGNRELVEQYDRLHGTNLSTKGGGLATKVGERAWSINKDAKEFVLWVYEYIWLRLDPDARMDDESLVVVPIMQKLLKAEVTA